MCCFCDLVDSETNRNRPKLNDCLTLERLPRTLGGRMDAYRCSFDSQGVEDSSAYLYASIRPLRVLESTTPIRHQFSLFLIFLPHLTSVYLTFLESQSKSDLRRLECSFSTTKRSIHTIPVAEFFENT
jgi:hypothetical protein